MAKKHNEELFPNVEIKTLLMAGVPNGESKVDNVSLGSFAKPCLVPQNLGHDFAFELFLKGRSELIIWPKPKVIGPSDYTHWSELVFTWGSTWKPSCPKILAYLAKQGYGVEDIECAPAKLLWEALHYRVQHTFKSCKLPDYTFRMKKGNTRYRYFGWVWPHVYEVRVPGTLPNLRYQLCKNPTTQEYFFNHIVKANSK